MRNVIVKAGVVEVDVMPLDHVLVTIPKSLDTNDQVHRDFPGAAPTSSLPLLYSGA
jgi:hypothetical protein